MSNPEMSAANENFEQRQEERDRLLVIVALNRRLENIYPASVEATAIRDLLGRLSNPAANDDEDTSDFALLLKQP